MLGEQPAAAATARLVRSLRHAVGATPSAVVTLMDSSSRGRGDRDSSYSETAWKTVASVVEAVGAPGRPTDRLEVDLGGRADGHRAHQGSPRSRERMRGSVGRSS